MKFPVKMGEYVLVSRLAYGGMAEIYKAKRLGAASFEKDLAIKRILPQIAEEREFVQMFIDEATLVAKLVHANIVQIFDFGEVDGNYFIAMEYVEGQNLRKVIQAASDKDRLLTVGQAVHIVGEVCKGLTYAHSRKEKDQPMGIVHRDISPPNILVSYAGEVKLVDFGIAKARSRITTTRRGLLKGKFAYMSPEQARGGDVDQQTDIFAAGAIFWELLAGRPLFDDESEIKVLHNVMECRIPSVMDFRPAVPEEIEPILARALAKDKSERYQTAAEMGTDLQRFLFGHLKEAVDLGAFLAEIFAEEIFRSQEESSIQSRELAELRTGAIPVLNVSTVTQTKTPTGTYTDSYGGTPTGTPSSITRVPERSSPVRWVLTFSVVIIAMALLAIVAILITRKGMQQGESMVASAVQTSGQASPDLGPKAPALPVGRPASPSVAPAPEAPKAVDLIIKTVPGNAKVVVDSKAMGNAPVIMKDMEVGREYQVVLSATGWQTLKDSFKATADQTEVTFRLTKLEYGYLDAHVVPWAEIWYRGRKLGETPTTKLKLPAGNQTLTFINPDLKKRVKKRVNIQPDKTSKVRFNLHHDK